MYTERNQDTEKQPLDFGYVVWFNFGKGERLKKEIFDHPKKGGMAYNVTENPKRVSFFKKRGIHSGRDAKPPPLYQQYSIPLKKPKADDLSKLVSSFVPSEYQHFYAEPTDGSDSSNSDEA